MPAIVFSIEKKMPRRSGRAGLGRAGRLVTPHGVIETPAFVTVGTKATVKSLTPEQVASLGAQVVLANTYHLYLQPGHERVRAGGGLGNFMGWSGPTMTDSGGFQAFSLGAAYGNSVSKVAKVTSNQVGAGLATPPQVYNKVRQSLIPSEISSGSLALPESPASSESAVRFAAITEDGVEFRSVIDGSQHFFSPEKSIEIQHAIGADMIFAFDECTSPTAAHEYQRQALDRTHRWAKRCLDFHKNARNEKQALAGQALLGIVQGGRHEDLRKESARVIGAMDFDGFGIGGSFDKEDMNTAVGWVNELLPPDRPRHLLGIGEPSDLFGAVENGCDLFDCVAPTRIARNGTLYTHAGTINISNARFADDFSPIEAGCGCYTCTHFTRAYLAHLFRAHEILANTLASIHNLYFIIALVKGMRAAILDDRFEAYKNSFLQSYYR